MAQHYHASRGIPAQPMGLRHYANLRGSGPGHGSVRPGCRVEYLNPPSLNLVKGAPAPRIAVGVTHG